MKNFTDSVAAITGAGSGMGRSLAIQLAREGCHLALADRNAASLAETAQLAQAAAPQIVGAPLLITTRVLDVSDRAAMFDWAAETAAQHRRVNLVFNNAGVALSSTIEGMDYADLEWIVGVNFWGVVHGTKAFLPYLQASGAGHIVNTSSVFGLFAQPGMSGYNATKFAVRGFTESLRQELDLMKCGVSATCVHPGGIHTGIAQSSRIASNMVGFMLENEQQGKDDFEKFFITTADEAARVILDGVRKNKRRVLIGRDARAADWLARSLPAAYQALVVMQARRMKRGAENARAAPRRSTAGAYEPRDISRDAPRDPRTACDARPAHTARAPCHSISSTPGITRRKAMMPIRRDLRFNLPPERACDWHVQGSHVTHFFNALSLLFPAGERFFMDSVRHYRDQIDDPVLKKQVLGFIGQEAMHTREHIEYNDLLQEAGLPAHKLDKRLWAILNFGRKILPPSYQLAVTVCLEHYTAMLAGLLLEDASRVGGSVEGYAQMWTWHALEETEHKSVSYDVWNAVLKPGLGRYLLRTGTMLATTLTFWLIVFDYHLRLLIADRKRGGHLRGMWRVVMYLYGPQHGVFPRIAGEWLSFFRPGFHPWDHDNRAQLARIDGLVAAVDAANASAPGTRKAARRGVQAAA